MSAITATPRKSVGRVEFIALAAGLMALNAVAIDILLPGLPQIGESLHIIDDNHRQLIVSAYMIGAGVMQLLFGPITDRFGRKAPLIAGVVVYVLAAGAAVFAPNLTAIIILRLIQGAGAAGTRVVALSVVRDKFSGRAMGEIMSMVFMVFMIVPIVAPSIGQGLLFIGSWHLIFIFMVVLALVIGVWAHIRLPETLAPEDRRPLSMASIVEGFRIVCSNRMALTYALAGMFMFGANVSAINSVEQIYGELFELHAWFAIAFAAIGVSLCISSYANSRLVRRFGLHRVAHTALVIFTTLSIIWCALAITGNAPFPVFFVLHLAIMFCFGCIPSNMNSMSMEPLGSVAGTASSIFGFIQMLGGAILGMIIGQLYNGTVIPITAAFALFSLLSIILSLVAENGKLFYEPTE